MNLTRIKLLNFRNYEKTNVVFQSGINILFGANAQGKTNLLEAIQLLANGKSFRVVQESKMIRDGMDSAYLFAEYAEKEIASNVEMLLEREKRKGIKLDGVPVRSMKELFGNLMVVVFSPEDMKMAKEAPGLRRGFLDAEISKIRPAYVDALKTYTKIIAQKNALLRRRDPRVAPQLAAFHEQLAGVIGIILKNRIAYVKKLNEFVPDIHKKISGDQESIQITYRCTIKPEQIAQTLEKNIPREIQEGSCFCGPHRDDLEILLNEKEVKYYASQGQLRTLMLSVKAACLKILEESTGKRPVLLLDDVFSELDASRKQNLLQCLRNLQVFITMADRSEIMSTPDMYFFEVKDGRVIAVK